MAETRWWKYVKKLLGDDTFKAAATRAGFNQSAFSRWSRGASADPAFVVKLARAYDANVLEALVEAGFLTEEEASLTEVAPRTDLKEISTKNLLNEIGNRTQRLDYLLSLPAELIQQLIEAASKPERGWLLPDDTPVDELAHRRKSNDQGDDTTPDIHDGGYDPLHHVAYSGPDEDKLREIEEHGEDYDWTDPNQIP